MMRPAMIISLLVLAGCTAQNAEDVSRFAVADHSFAPVYSGIETHLLDGDLVRFIVDMTGARTNDDVARYAECAAAQYTLIRGYGFARHVRTNVLENNGEWRADAVFTISESLPRGLKTIDAEVVVANCADNNIPTV